MGGMIPLGDASRRTSRWPLVTVSLIALNVYVFFRELMYGDQFVLYWSVIPREIMSGHGWLTLLTATFMHASWSHIIGNMVFFWSFGPTIEDAMGRWKFLFFYLIGGIIAMLAQVVAAPMSTVPNLGASGAIAAVMGAFLVTYPRDRIRTLLFLFIFVRIAFVPAALLIGFWFLTQLFSAGEVSRHVQTGGVAYLAHIGGFLFGVLTARLWEGSRRTGWQ